MSAPSRFPCAGCGTDLVFDPVSKGLKCPSCGAQQTIEVPEGEVEEHDYLAAIERTAEREPIAEGALQVTCSSCGATVSFQPPQVAGECAFCAAKIVMQPKLADPVIAPGAILPFALPADKARQSVQTWIGGLWFAPSALKKLAAVDGMKGVYLPFWTFDAATLTAYRGERGVDRRVQVQRTNAQGQRYTTTEVQTDWYPAAGEVRVDFDDVVVPATRSVDNQRVDSLDPWDFDQLVPYDPRYLPGFQAQRYQVELQDGLPLAKKKMEPVIHSAICRDIGGDRQRVHQTQTRYGNIRFRHLLLPIWIGAYRFQGKVFQIAVNARTAEVQGERPYSWPKILFTLLLVILAIVTIVKLSE